MIRIKRSKLRDALTGAMFPDSGFENQVFKDLKRGNSQIALKYAVKSELIKISNEVLAEEIREMGEKSLISIEVYEQQQSLLANSPTGNERVRNFLLNKNRFVVING